MTTEQSSVKWRVPFRMRKTTRNFEVRLGPPGGDKVRGLDRRLSEKFVNVNLGLQGNYWNGPAIYQHVLVDQRLDSARAAGVQGADLLLQGTEICRYVYIIYYIIYHKCIYIIYHIVPGAGR